MISWPLRLLVGVSLSAIVVAIVVVYAAGGHGTYRPARLLIPFAMLVADRVPTTTWITIPLAVLQFPVYAIFATSKTKLAGIAAVHLIAVTLGLFFASSMFTP